MNRHILVPGLALAITLTACNEPADDREQVSSVDLDQPAAGDVPAPPPPSPAPSDDAANDGLPDLEPGQLDPIVERTETGARNVLLSFARAIELEEWDQAWGMLDDASKRRWPRAQWRDLFAGMGEITVAVPNGEMEGAAGSSYYSVPATITGDAGNTRYEGTIVLKRINDVPGAAAQQLRWHIDSVDLTRAN